ncbi:hypothetical protein BKA70DRAFT_1241897 [Coprinopsis sp. MPI-PUGE-AT-0042]|nr:hypothetical protein BKA70DRAFT_1241897 [Coprinopsis sp. MPI-PUGE-AT-0042]
MITTSVAFKRRRSTLPIPPLKSFTGTPREPISVHGAGPSNYETGERIAPSELEDHRDRTHHFMAPCCLCAISTDEGYVESKIGWYGSPRSNKPESMGISGFQEVLCMTTDTLYGSSFGKILCTQSTSSQAYPKRASPVLPLLPQQLNYISDVDPESEANGLSQALPFSGIGTEGQGIVEGTCNLEQCLCANSPLYGPVVLTKNLLANVRPIRWADWKWRHESLSGDTEIIDWDDTDTDDEMPPLEPLE